VRPACLSLILVVLPAAVMVAVNVSTVEEPAVGDELATSKLQVKDWPAPSEDGAAGEHVGVIVVPVPAGPGP
jgi:hypothetical protein